MNRWPRGNFFSEMAGETPAPPGKIELFTALLVLAGYGGPGQGGQGLNDLAFFFFMPGEQAKEGFHSSPCLWRATGFRL